MRKIITQVAILCILFLVAKTGSAQLNYQAGGFSTFAGTYNDITATGTTVTMTNNDTGYSNAPIPIGFTFNYNGTPFTNLTMYVDGFVKLGGGTVSWATNMLFTTFAQPPAGGPFNSSASTTVGYAQPQDTDLIFAFGQDLWGAAGGTGTPTFKYITTGTVGSRICTMQWKGLSDKTQNAVLSQYDTINFQLKLYESTNAIEIVFGPWSTSTNVSNARFAAIGLKGNNTLSVCELLTFIKASSTAWSLTVANSQTASVPLGNISGNAVNYGNAISGSRPAPGSGTTFHFNPVVNFDISVNTVYAQGKIALPFYTADSIRVNISNTGINAMNFFSVTLSISGANSYTNTVVVPTLAGTGGVGPVQSMNVSFPPYTPTNNGQNIIKVYTAPDDNLLNDTATYGMSVGARNISWTDSTRGPGQSYGTTITTAWTNRYYVNGTVLVSQVKSFVAGNSSALGDTICGVILDTLGNILGRSPNYIIQAADLGATLTFNITNPPVLRNTPFLAGIGTGITVVAATTYFLGTVQNEVPNRPTTTFYPYISCQVSNVVSSGISTLKAGDVFGTSISYNPFPGYRLMMECSVDPDTADVGISASIPANNSTVPTGSAISLRAYVKNFGSAFKGTGLSVKYSVDGGTAIGPINTTVGLNQNDTTSVYFTGANAFTIASAGTHTIKIYTTYGNDQNRGNDTLTLTITAATPISTFPYRLANGIYTTWTPVGNASALWNQTTATQPNGVSNATVLYMNNTALNMAGIEAKMVSPIFSFAGIARPTLNFYVANAPNTTASKDDTLQVLVSTNGGATYTAVYTRSSQLSSPTLGTIAASATAYTPAVGTDWRHENVDLSAYAGNPYVVIAFRGKSAGGNNVYIGDIIISNPATINTQAVPFANTYTSGIMSVNFSTTIGAATGSVSINRYTGAPFSSATPVYATNSTATAPSAVIFTPSNVSPDNWWTICYSGLGTGNLPASVPYYIQVNIAGIGGMLHPDSLYIMKRTENNGSWTALTTSRVSTILFAGPITGFSDFAIGSQPLMNTLPVKWLSVSASKSDNDVMVNWSTAAEKNNDHFVVERSVNLKDFIAVGEVKASGNTNTKSDYSFNDKDGASIAHVIYYRVRQVDNDGSSTISNVVSVNVNEIVQPIVAFPNPFTHELEININSKTTSDINISITDLSGREVYRKTEHHLSNSAIVLNDLSRLENGFYLMKVSYDGEVHTLKINKAE